MIEQRWINSLDDPDVEIRKRAVEAITKAGTSEAMILLAKVYRHDPDPELRELARQGGITLRTQGITMETNASTTPSSTPEPIRQTATPENSVFYGETTSREGSWADVSQILLAYGLVMAVITFIVAQLFLGIFDPVFTEIENTTFNSIEERDLALRIVDITRGGTLFFFVVAVLYGIWSIVSLVIQTYLIDYLAINSFNGQGNMFSFVPKYAIANGIFMIGIFVIFAFLILTVVDSIASTTTAMTTNQSSAIPNSVCSLVCFFLFGILGLHWYCGRLIGGHYKISTFQGIGAFLAGTIATQILGGFISNILQGILVPFF